MVMVRIPTIGEILLNLATTTYAGGFFYILGHDTERTNYTIKCSRLSLQDDLSSEYGWVNIVGYYANEIFTPCQHYSSLA